MKSSKPISKYGKCKLKKFEISRTLFYGKRCDLQRCTHWVPPDGEIIVRKDNPKNKNGIPILKNRRWSK